MKTALPADALMRARFEVKVDRSGGPDVCHPWLRAKHEFGYGVFGVRKGVIMKAHRVAWEFTHGAIPAGMCVLHQCDNPGCVNPRHLFLGTDLDNKKDAHTKGRVPHGAVHWTKPHGNPVRGSRHPLAKLTEADVRKIRKLAARGFSSTEIAAKYPVPARRIRRIVARECWPHVE